MENNSIRHEIVSSNPDIDVRFYLSEDSGSYVAPHWHNSLEANPAALLRGPERMKEFTP